MHEYSLIQSLVTRVEDEVRARGAIAVRRLRVSVGELSGVDPELLTTAYETFRAGTCCADAALEVRHVAAEWRCRACQTPLARGELLRCPRCHEPADLTTGGEIVLEQIELEVP